MKSSLYLTSILVVAVLMSCSNNKNNQKTGHEPMGVSTQTVGSSGSADTTKIGQGSAVAGEAGSKKDASDKDTKYSKKSKKEAKEASKNEASNQAAIDSLKKAKEKEKRP